MSCHSLDQKRGKGEGRGRERSGGGGGEEEGREEEEEERREDYRTFKARGIARLDAWMEETVKPTRARGSWNAERG